MTAEPITYDVGIAPSDGALAADHLQGGDTAFAELYRRYHPRLVRFCTRRTGDRYLAEDIAQETLLRALRYLDGFDTSRPMWPWLKTIASRIAYQLAQKAAFERCDDISEVDPDSARAENPCLRIDDQLVLEAALSRVPTRQRAALLMRYVDDWSTADSAKFAGMSVPAFEQLLFRARRRLGTEYKRLTETRGALALTSFAAAFSRWVGRVTTRVRPEHAALPTVTSHGIGVAGAALSVAVLVIPALPFLNGGSRRADAATEQRGGAAVVRPVEFVAHAPAVTTRPGEATTVRRPGAAKPHQNDKPRDGGSIGRLPHGVPQPPAEPPAEVPEETPHTHGRPPQPTGLPVDRLPQVGPDCGEIFFICP